MRVGTCARPAPAVGQRGTALRRDSVPRQALLKARHEDIIALSAAVEQEIREVLGCPKFVRSLTDEDRAAILALVTDVAVRVEPAPTVHDCRDAKDDKYPEPAAAAGAEVIITSDSDLLVLDPWRGIRIVRPVDFLASSLIDVGGHPRRSPVLLGSAESRFSVPA
ncbi:MAG: putative toxin-antitoxin system toxin component, PIN family [Acetobacteraceae bacterium]